MDSSAHDVSRRGPIVPRWVAYDHAEGRASPLGPSGAFGGRCLLEIAAPAGRESVTEASRRLSREVAAQVFYLAVDLL